MKETPRRKLRCAIYTRKSTEEGLEMEFNTLDAQREAGEAYITSQKQEGWIALADHYDDGGFTGANTDRPALKRLLRDVQARLIDVVVPVKVPVNYIGIIKPILNRSIPAPAARQEALQPVNWRM